MRTDECFHTKSIDCVTNPIGTFFFDDRIRKPKEIKGDRRKVDTFM